MTTIQQDIDKLGVDIEELETRRKALPANSPERVDLLKLMTAKTELMTELLKTLNSHRRGGVPVHSGPTLQEIEDKLASITLSLSFIIESMMDPWENIRSETSEIVRNEEAAHLDDISNFYQIPKMNYCMVLGANCTNCDIICAHIWPRHTFGKELPSLGLESRDVNHPRNFLRLHKAVLEAFDQKRITFFPLHSAEGKISLELHVLDPALMTDTFQASQQSISFESLHQHKIAHVFGKDKKPFMRLLASHAQRATRKAKDMGWINTDFAGREQRALEMAHLTLDREKRPVMSAFLAP